MTDPASGLVLLTALLAKHFLADFVLQSRFILNNRSTYGHPGGLLHVAIHASGSVVIFALFGAGPALLSMLFLFEAVVHYHIDWTKDNLNERLGLTTEDRGYWVLMGFDQFLHQLTYILMVGFVLARGL